MKHLAAISLLVGSALLGCNSNEDEVLGNLFFERGVEGGILISAENGKTEFVSNADRMETPFSPDATFFLPGVLIALSEKAVADEKETLSWDGEDRGLAEWNRDQSLESAYRFSCVWFFQEMAERVGRTRNVSQLKAMKYGNGNGGKDVTSFWSSGDLKITAKEQIAFLKSLRKETLPIPKAHQQLLKAWMAVRRTATYVLYGKTAWASHTPTRHGWNIGFVETKSKGTWYFALNLMLEQASQAAFRQEIVYEALHRKGII